MALRVRFDLLVRLGSAAGSEECDLGKLQLAEVIDSQNEGGTFQTIVAGNAVDVPLQLTGIATARVIAIRVQPVDPTLALGDVNLKKNGIGGEAWLLRPASGLKESFFCVTTDGITALYVSNLGANAVKVTVAVAGD